jgi:hypothetical protein
MRLFSCLRTDAIPHEWSLFCEHERTRDPPDPGRPCTAMGSDRWPSGQPALGRRVSGPVFEIGRTYSISPIRHLGGRSRVRCARRRVMATLHRPKPPSLSTIIDYWAEPDQEDKAVLPNLRSWFIGWGEPFCFACGWLPPLRTDKAWAEKDVSQWLDLAHLIDHALGGSSEPSNLVPLCIFCHDAMPSFSERTPALEWILGREGKMPNPRIWQLFTDACPLIGRQHRNYRMQKDAGELSTRAPNHL